MAMALKHQLGVSYPTAWLLDPKINRAMAQQDSTHRLGSGPWRTTHPHPARQGHAERPPRELQRQVQERVLE